MIELLVVVALMGLLLAISVPAVIALKDSQDISGSVSEISKTLEYVRAYAMANNTYAYVGIVEVNGTQSVTQIPQADGEGRVVVVAVASRDGSAEMTGVNLTALGKPQIFDRVHLVDLTQLPGATRGLMASRRLIESGASLARSEAEADTGVFAWPLTGAAKFSFRKVIRFDAQGSAMLQNGTELLQWLEIAVQPMKGASAPQLTSLESGQVISLQIDGVTGAARTYRP